MERESYWFNNNALYLFIHLKCSRTIARGVMDRLPGMFRVTHGILCVLYFEGVKSEKCLCILWKKFEKLLKNNVIHSEHHVIDRKLSRVNQTCIFNPNSFSYDFQKFWKPSLGDILKWSFYVLQIKHEKIKNKTLLNLP